jgi:Vacuolar-sorting protein 54, of GARP complex
VQQLVHHVAANTDNLTAGIQTCRSTGTLLQKAIVSVKEARARLGLAGTDASTCLKIAMLYRRNQQLANMMETCSHALTLQQKSAEAECVP